MDGRFDPLARLFVAGIAGGGPQLGVAAVGMKRVFGGKNEVAAIGGGKLELLCHAHGAIGGGLLAFAAEDAAAVVHCDLARAVVVADGDGTSRARVGSRTRVAPGGEVELRASAKLLDQARRNARIIGRRGADA